MHVDVDACVRVVGDLDDKQSALRDLYTVHPLRPGL